MKRPTGKEIRDAVAYWRIALGLEAWEYTVRIGKMPDGEWGEAAVDVPYKRVAFRFYPKGMVEHGETVDGMAAHEWLHCLVGPLANRALEVGKPKDYEGTRDAEEALTTDLERLVLRLHKRPRP